MAVLKKVFNIFSLLAQFLVLLGALSLGVFGIYKMDPLEGLFSSTILPYIQMSIGASALFLIAMRFL